MTLARQQQSLNLGGGDRVGGSGIIADFQVEPFHAGGGDLEFGLQPFEILFRRPFQALFEGDFPGFLQTRIDSGKEVQHGVLPDQLQLTVGIRPCEPCA
jgi:hypothetical protein